MDKFNVQITCKECKSTDVHICNHLDYTGGMDEAVDYTNNIVLVCQNNECRNKELMKLQYEIVY